MNVDVGVVLLTHQLEHMAAGSRESGAAPAAHASRKPRATAS
jgi:hypothetical protein